MLLVMAAGAKTKDEFQWWILSRFVYYAQFLWSWIVSVAYFAKSSIVPFRIRSGALKILQESGSVVGRWEDLHLACFLS